MAKPHIWDPEKSRSIREKRGFGFEEIVEAIESGNVLADVVNSSPRYPDQRIYVLRMKDYVVALPYVEDDEFIFLKTAFFESQAQEAIPKGLRTMQKATVVDDDDFLDDEEREISRAIDEAIDNETLVDRLKPERKAEIEASARATINPPKKPITTRLSVHDLAKLKARAMQLGMPYQTLLASIVHQYVEGRLVERD